MDNNLVREALEKIKNQFINEKVIRKEEVARKILSQINEVEEQVAEELEMEM